MVVIHSYQLLLISWDRLVLSVRYVLPTAINYYNSILSIDYELLRGPNQYLSLRIQKKYVVSILDSQ